MTALKRILDSKNISVHELARMTGIPAPTIYRYINNQRDPRFSKLSTIAKALDVSIEELTKEDE